MRLYDAEGSLRGNLAILWFTLALRIAGIALAVLILAGLAHIVTKAGANVAATTSQTINQGDHP